MSRFLGALCAALLFAFSQSAIGAPPVEAFGSLPAAKLARLSPDGKHLAVIRPINGSEQVMFLDLSTPNSTPYVVGVFLAVASDVIWKSNDRAICLFHTSVPVPKKAFTWTQAISVNLSTHTQVRLMASDVADRLADDPTHIYMEDGLTHIYLENGQRVDRKHTLGLYRVDVATGNGEIVSRGDGTVRFLMDGYGHVVGRVDQDTDLTNHVILGSREVFQYRAKGGADFQLEGLTKGDNPQVVAKETTPYGTIGLYKWTEAGRGAALFENQSYDLSGVLTDEKDGRVIGITYDDDTPHTKYFAPAVQRIQTSLENAFPGQFVQIESKDASGSTYVILTEGPKSPPVLSLFTRNNHQVNIIEEYYQGIKPSDLGDVRPYPYKARDGLDIHAYLTLPPGRDPHNLPTVVFPHGGPEARDVMAFDWWAQFMASRGYAVLQPNFRGSAGYGLNFKKAGDGEWAGKVQYDVQDGVEKLITDGIADPKRICIVGASYGGYMALAGATFSPDLYACAVSFAGLSDLRRLVYASSSFESEDDSIWQRRTGADLDSRKLDAESPANFADRVKIPILLIASDADSTVPIAQSLIERDALKSAGKQVGFVLLNGDDHYLEFAETRTTLLREIERFLAAHIGDHPTNNGPMAASGPIAK